MTTTGATKDWGSEPAWKLPKWAEPMLVVCILFTAMTVTRRRRARIFYPVTSWREYFACLSPDGSSEWLLSPSDTKADSAMKDDTGGRDMYQQHSRRCCGISIRTPNTKIFAPTLQSRILNHFPFLVEMFYWVLNYLFYCFTSTAAQRLADTGIWKLAQANGVAVLDAEHKSAMRFFFPITEQAVQHWFINNHHTSLTVLNKAYALIHIPGTAAFIGWYYYVAPSFKAFAKVRRTMVLTNFLAFITYILYPCMPPRLLPAEYGFLDTVRRDSAESVWMSGKYVNSLAAMPSVHFAYAFCVGATLVYHSGYFRRGPEATSSDMPLLGSESPVEVEEQSRKDRYMTKFLVALGIGYPTFLFVTIVATGNHYFLDAIVAIWFVLVAYFCNNVVHCLLPLEDLFLWVLCAEKPAPTTGTRFLQQMHMAISLPPPVSFGTAVVEV